MPNIFVQRCSWSCYCIVRDAPCRPLLFVKELYLLEQKRRKSLSRKVYESKKTQAPAEVSVSKRSITGAWSDDEVTVVPRYIQKGSKFGSVCGAKSLQYGLYFAWVYSNPGFIDDVPRERNDFFFWCTHTLIFPTSTRYVKPTLSRFSNVPDDPVTFSKTSSNRRGRLSRIQDGPPVR